MIHSMHDVAIWLAGYWFGVPMGALVTYVVMLAYGRKKLAEWRQGEKEEA